MVVKASNHEKILLLLFCALVALTGNTQTNISGNITDNKSGDTLGGASVFIIESSEGVTSNMDGSFSLSTDQAVPFKVVVSYVGYQDYEIMVSENMELNIVLKAQALLGETIIVSASRKSEKINEAPASISVIEARRLNSKALSHVSQHLHNVMGVHVSQQGVDHYQISLRGKERVFGTDTYFLHDYRTLTAPGTGVATLSRTPLQDIDLDRIEIVRGPGSALYGPGVETGVIHFISRSPFDEGTTVRVVGGTQSSFSIAGRHAKKVNDKMAFKFLSYYNRAKDFPLDPNDPDDAASIAEIIPTVTSAETGEVLFENITSFEEQIESYGITGTLEYKLGEETSLTATAGWAYRAGLVRASLGEALGKHPNYYGQVRFSSKNLFMQGFLNILDNVNEKGFLYRTGLSSKTKNSQYQFLTQYEFDNLPDKLDLIVGVEAQVTINRTNGTVHGRYEDEDNFGIYSGFAQAKYNLTNKLDVVAAARFDRFSAIDENTVSPRFGLIYNASPTQTVRLTYNKAVSSPISLDIYADIPFGITPAFNVHFMGELKISHLATLLSHRVFLEVPMKE